eukprot:scaffold261_cov336-Pavlova_lutheri.AAC.71
MGSSLPFPFHWIPQGAFRPISWGCIGGATRVIRMQQDERARRDGRDAGGRGGSRRARPSAKMDAGPGREKERAVEVRQGGLRGRAEAARVQRGPRRTGVWTKLRLDRFYEPQQLPQAHAKAPS